MGTECPVIRIILRRVVLLNRKRNIPYKCLFGMFLLYWRRHPDLNWGIKVLQTSALPLGYGALERKTRFELATLALARRCSTTEPLPQTIIRWCPEAESNHRHEDFQSSALPTELSGHIAIWRPGRDSNPRPLA